MVEDLRSFWIHSDEGDAGDSTIEKFLQLTRSTGIRNRSPESEWESSDLFQHKSHWLEGRVSGVESTADESYPPDLSMVARDDGVGKDLARLNSSEYSRTGHLHFVC